MTHTPLIQGGAQRFGGQRGGRESWYSRGPGGGGRGIPVVGGRGGLWYSRSSGGGRSARANTTPGPLGLAAPLRLC